MQHGGLPFVPVFAIASGRLETWKSPACTFGTAFQDEKYFDGLMNLSDLNVFNTIAAATDAF